MQKDDVQHVFLIGAKSLGAYGGYETFINKLTEYHQNNKRIKYHVACKGNGDGSMDPYQTEGAQIINDHEFTYHNAHCFQVKILEKLGPAQAIYYDVAALKKSCEIINRDKIEHPIVYIMACRIGPFMKHYYHKIHKLGGKIYLNPDGHEFLRAKWSWPIRKYWKLSEQMMVKWSDLVICDSKTIEQYIHECYDGKGIKGRKPKTTFIAYGAETRKSKLADNDNKLLDWYAQKGLKPFDYYLVVGRFVPENNYETMIREFMRSHTTKVFAIITNVNEKFLDELEYKLHFKKDKRIKFVGTVYDQELLMKIRENAYGYFHGHEVGGTNPSLLEALGSTDLNLLLNVGFNKEVAEDAAIYWTKNQGNLAKLVDNADKMGIAERKEYGRKAKARIKDAYSWQFITHQYENVFVNGHNSKILNKRSKD
ncbi:MAG: beta 1-4 rhamnosyltransferase Cps2T [Lachnospiraceae bacterium]